MDCVKRFLHCASLKSSTKVEQRGLICVKFGNLKFQLREKPERSHLILHRGKGSDQYRNIVSVIIKVKVAFVRNQSVLNSSTVSYNSFKKNCFFFNIVCKSLRELFPHEQFVHFYPMSQKRDVSFHVRNIKHDTLFSKASAEHTIDH